MQEYMQAYDEKIINRCCATCEFNFCGECAGGDDAHPYGHTITDENDVCTDWGPSLDYFIELEKTNEEFVRNLDPSKVVKKCGNCDHRVGDECYGMEPPFSMIVPPSNPGCDKWKANNDYVIELRNREQEG